MEVRETSTWATISTGHSDLLRTLRRAIGEAVASRLERCARNGSSRVLQAFVTDASFGCFRSA